MTLRPLVLALALAACGGQTSTSPAAGKDAGAPTTVDGACAAQSSANCALRDTCTGGVGTEVDYGGSAKCVSLLTASCLANARAPDTGTTVAHLDGCAAAYPTESCVDWYDGNTVTACRSALGSRANGDVCGVSSQCTSGFCLVGANAACGTCQPVPVAGATCETSGNCQYDLDCPFYAPATSGVCTTRGDVGASCDQLHRCQGGLGCVGSDTATNTPGTCQTAATTVGAACNGKTGPDCDGTLYLTCVEGTCENETLARPGAPCGSLPSGYAECSAGATCITPSGPCQHGTSASCGSAVGTCMAPAATGAACDTGKGPLCLSPARCIVTAGGGTRGTCVFPDPASCG